MTKEDPRKRDTAEYAARNMLDTEVENGHTGKGTCVQLVAMPICAQCVENVYEVVLTVVRLLIQITCIISCIPDKRIEQLTTLLVMNMEA